MYCFFGNNISNSLGLKQMNYNNNRNYDIIKPILVEYKFNNYVTEIECGYFILYLLN